MVVGPEGPEALLVTQYRYLSARRRRIPRGSACRLLMGTYLREYRPLLIQEPTAALFPGGCGARSAPGSCGSSSAAWSMRLAGVEMTPTAFRHFAAKHYLERHPGDFGIVRACSATRRSLAPSTPTRGSTSPAWPGVSTMCYSTSGNPQVFLRERETRTPHLGKPPRFPPGAGRPRPDGRRRSLPLGAWPAIFVTEVRTCFRSVR